MSPGAGDTVTCTFTESPATTLSGLFIRKVSLGGLDTFGYTVRRGDRRGSPRHPSRRPRARYRHGCGGARGAGGPTYTIEEDLPASDVGERRSRRSPAPAGRPDPSRSARPRCASAGLRRPARPGTASRPPAASASPSARSAEPRGPASRSGPSGSWAKLPGRPRRHRVRAGRDDHRAAHGGSCEAEARRPEQHRQIDVGTYVIPETVSAPGEGGLWRSSPSHAPHAGLERAGPDRRDAHRRSPDHHLHLVHEPCRSPRPRRSRRRRRPRPPCRPHRPAAGQRPRRQWPRPPRAELRVTKTVTPRRIRLGRSARYRVVVRNLGPATARARLRPGARPQPRAREPGRSTPPRAPAAARRRATARSATCSVRPTSHHHGDRPSAPHRKCFPNVVAAPPRQPPAHEPR